MPKQEQTQSIHKCKKCKHIIIRIYADGLCSSCRASSRGIKKPSKLKYGHSGHGSKGSIQKLFNTTGTTHQSEHTIGYAALSHLKRGKSATAKSIENYAPAYQEKYARHRAHIGTGSSKQRDGSGFNSGEYRKSQRSLLVAGDASSAIQLNQLAYAFLKGFQGDQSSAAIKAHDSFEYMMLNLDRVTYCQKDGSTVSVSMSALQQCEAFLSRVAASTGKWPTQEQINEAMRRFGIPKKS